MKDVNAEHAAVVSMRMEREAISLSKGEISFGSGVLLGLRAQQALCQRAEAMARKRAAHSSVIDRINDS